MVGFSVTMVPVPGGDRPSSSEPFVQLSAARWARLWTLIARYDQPPPEGPTFQEAQDLLLAILYRALTGVDWDALPSWAPPANRVQAAFLRWRCLGLLDRLAADLLIQLDAGEQRSR